MRIALLTSEFVTEPIFWGGLGNYLFRICLALKLQGHKPVVFVIANKDETIIFRDIEVHRVRCSSPFALRLIDRLTFKKLSLPLVNVALAITISRALRTVHRKCPFDIVQVSNYRAFGLFLPREIPSVVRISSYEPLWRTAYNKPLDAAQWLIEFLEATAFKRADRLYGPSRLISEVIGSNLNLDIDVIEPPFIAEPLDFDMQPYQRHLADKRYLLFFGTIGLMKGCKTIADILEPFLLKHRDLWFVFAGPIENYHDRPMTAYIAERTQRVSDRVSVLPPLEHSALYPIIQGASGIVLPSRIDNFPNACIEAMYWGQIVVGTKGTTFEQLIDHGVSGFLCSPDNPDSLKKALEELLSLEPEERAKISANARIRIEALSPERVVRNLIAFYDRVIQSRLENRKDLSPV